MQIEPQLKKIDKNAGLALKPQRLTQVILVVILAISLSIVINISEHKWPAVSILAIFCSLLTVAFVFAKKDSIELSAKITVITLTCAMGLLSFLFDGIYDAAVCAFPAIMIFAAMFVTRRFFIILLLVILSILTLLVVLNLTGLHVNKIATVSLASLINIASIILATSFFVWKLASDLRIALALLETENERIRNALTHIDTLAHNDALTGLPNRLLARARFEQAVDLSKRGNERTAVINLDLDNFKTVNDSLGHAAGDLLLCEVASRLKQAIRASDTVSRQGGDEFLIVIAGQADQESVATVAVKIIELLSAPFQINGMEISATCSLGIALYPDDGNTFDTLLKNADIAMYKAKDSGRNGFRFYDVDMNTNVIEHLHLISGIRSALLKNEFKLHYQPQFDLRTGQIIGAEALIRWQNPELGIIPPSKFIPVAERSGQIHEIGTWVLGEACRQTKAWQDQGLQHFVVAVNLSPVQFRRDNIERDLMNALDSSGLHAAFLELELTESLLIVESDQISPLLKRLRAMGIHLSIDDFGTGYSNLGYLSRFEVERLKIDQSFIRKMIENPRDEGIVRAIIEMAHSLKLEVVAEGVENQAVLHRLIELGCEFGQGYFWTPALAPDEFFRYVTQHNASS